MHSHGWIIRFGRAVAVLRGDADADEDTLRLTRRADKRVVPIMAELRRTVCWKNIVRKGARSRIL